MGRPDRYHPRRGPSTTFDLQGPGRRHSQGAGRRHETGDRPESEDRHGGAPEHDGVERSYPEPAAHR